MSDFQFERPRLAQDTLFRINIDDARGAVERGAFQVMETPFATNEKANFTGTIRYLAESDDDADRVQKAVTKGLRWITSLGAERTSGFGQLIDVAVSLSKTTQNELQKYRLQEPKADALKQEDAEFACWMQLRFEGPFCISQRRVAENVFESADLIGGQVLRGALVTMLTKGLKLPSDCDLTEVPVASDWQVLCRNFNRIRFSFAHPIATEAGTESAENTEVKENKLPVRWPFSLVVTGNAVQGDVEKPTDLWDVALTPTAQLIEKKVPAFQTDWKGEHRNAISSRFGWVDIPKELRVRTQIDSDLRRAKDEQLFAYEMANPKDPADMVDRKDRVWITRLDLSDIESPDERQQCLDQLQSLLKIGLGFIGKTKVWAQIEFLPLETYEFAHPNSVQPVEDNRWIITLQSPAILCSPDQTDPRNHGQLRQHFESVWSELSSETLRLEQFYATHSLSGGYLAKRYQSTSSYRPYLLTDRGSVFVLKLAENKGIQDAQHIVENWLTNGLPMPRWTNSVYGENWSDDWRRCPFRQRDGFGAIAVNLPCHTNWKPDNV